MEFNDAYANDVEGPELQAYEEIMAQHIEKLWFLNTFNIILHDNGQQIVLQGEQVLKNRELISQEIRPPPKDVDTDEAATLARGHARATRSAASAHANQEGWAQAVSDAWITAPESFGKRYGYTVAAARTHQVHPGSYMYGYALPYLPNNAIFLPAESAPSSAPTSTPHSDSEPTVVPNAALAPAVAPVVAQTKARPTRRHSASSASYRLVLFRSESRVEKVHPDEQEVVPFFISASHEVHPVHDMAWTILEDRIWWEEKVNIRECTNLLIKEKLLRGSNVQFRASGWSMVPRVHEGDMCMYEPVAGEDSIKVADVVFCQVWPGKQFFAQHVLSIAKPYGVRYFDIGYCRAVGTRVVGYCTYKEIYGRLVEVVR